MTESQQTIRRVKCPKCEGSLGVPDKVFRKSVRCPKCESKFTPATEAFEIDEPILRRASTLESDRNAPSRVLADNVSAPKETSKPATARIIPAAPITTLAESVEELPVLKLTEEKQPLLKRTELSSNPVFLGVLICCSVLSSGLILFLAGGQTKTDRTKLNRVRKEISRFYETRIDVDLKPYQLELREAQMAYSRGDIKAEKDAYRKVMRRFRAEDRSQYAGVTGSPTSDAELEKLVSIMLGNGKTGAFQFF